MGIAADGARPWFLGGNGKSVPYQTWLASATGGTPQPFVSHSMEHAASPDGTRVAYHTDAPGDPIYLGDANGGHARRLYAAGPGGHCHYLSWSPDARYIYFVKGVPTTQEMDIWRVRTTGADAPERITDHNARVGYPAWLDRQTLIYSATAEDGPRLRLFTLDVNRRIRHRVSAGVGEDYLSVAASTTAPRRLVCSVANTSATLWTVPVSDQMQPDPRPRGTQRRTRLRMLRGWHPEVCSFSLRMEAPMGSGACRTMSQPSCGKAKTAAQ